MRTTSHSVTLLSLAALSSPGLAQSTAFTYQGRLNDSGQPATGLYDLRFTLYDAATNGTVRGEPVNKPATPVTNGLFFCAVHAEDRPKVQAAVAAGAAVVAPAHAAQNEAYAAYLPKGRASPFTDWLFLEIVGVTLGGLGSVGDVERDLEVGPGHLVIMARMLSYSAFGAALFTILSVKLGGTADPTRIAANIVTGVGFLGAGAIHPREGFQYAFQNGADFICVGMFDFQVAEDVTMANKVLAAIQDRAWPSAMRMTASSPAWRVATSSIRWRAAWPRT